MFLVLSLSYGFQIVFFTFTFIISTFNYFRFSLFFFWNFLLILIFILLKRLKRQTAFLNIVGFQFLPLFMQILSYFLALDTTCVSYEHCTQQLCYYVIFFLHSQPIFLLQHFNYYTNLTLLTTSQRILRLMYFFHDVMLNA